MGFRPPGTTDLRALVLPLATVLAADMTATTQAGPRPGPFRPSQSTSMALDASGTLDETVGALELVTLRAGGVGIATTRWRYEGETLRSWDPPTSISNWEYIDRSTTAGKYARPHVVRIPATGRVVACATEDTNTIIVERQTALGRWERVEVEDTGAATVGCLIPLANGRLVCVYTYAASTTLTQLRMAYSDDGGEQWTVGSTACLAGDPIAVPSDKILRLRGGELNGQLLLVAWEQDATDRIWQFVSTDGGGLFTQVEDPSPSDRAAPDVVVANGVLYLATVEYSSARTPSTVSPYIRKLGSAVQAFSSAEAIDAGGTVESSLWAVRSGGLLTLAECALLADDDGVLWIYGVDSNSGGGARREVVIRRSADAGVTWGSSYLSGYGPQTSLNVFFSGDSAIALRDLTVAPERGRAVMLHRLWAPSASDSLAVAYLGGWATCGRPESPLYNPGQAVIGWDFTWLAICEPDALTGGVAVPIAKTTSGAATSTLSDAGNALSVPAGAELVYSVTPTLAAPIADGLLVEWRLSVSTGSWVNEVRISDGAADYHVRVTASATGFTLRDMNAGADIASVSVSVSDGAVLRIALDRGVGTWVGNNGRVRAWYYDDGPYTGVIPVGPKADRKFVQIGFSGTLQSGAETTSLIQWGCSSPLVDASATYRWMCFSKAGTLAGNIADSVNGKTRGRTIPALTTPVHLVKGLRLAGKSGATVAGDVWTWRPSYEFPVEALCPRRNPSPRKVHRSLIDGIEHNITWSGLSLGWRPGDLFAVYVLGANVPMMTLYRGAGGATKVVEMNLATGLTGLGYKRRLSQMEPDPVGASAGFHFRENALIGARANLGAGAVRKLTGNTGGAWLASGTAGTYASSRLLLDGVVDGSDPASGTFDLWMPNGLFIVEGMQSTDELTLRIPATTTAEGHYELGKVLIGRVRILAHEYGRGWALIMEPSYQLTTTRGGARRGRALAPTRLAWEMAWDEGVDTSGTHTPGSAPDHVVLYGGGDALAAYADTPHTLFGAFRELGGAVTPGLFCPALPLQAAALTATAPLTLLDPMAALYGRIVSESMRFDNVLGEELRDPGPLGRMPVIRFEQEV